jgi:uncharacterized protein YacL
MTINSRDISIKQFFGLGAVLGFTEALLYGSIYTLVGIIYTTVLILHNLQTDVLATLSSNALSVLIGAMFFATLFGLVAAVLQGLAFGLTLVITRIAKAFISGKYVGLGVSLVFAALIHLMVITSPPIVFQVFWKLSYIFWLGIPCLIFIAVTTYFSHQVGKSSI